MTNPKITPYPELDTALENIAKEMQKALGKNFIGMYVQGSLAIGDFDLTSDIDFIIVTHKDLSQQEVKRVQEVHSRIYNQNNRWVKRIEYSFFPKDILQKPSSPFLNGTMDTSEERKLWYFNNGSPAIERNDHCNTLVTRWTVREKGVTMVGPDPKTFISPVAPDDLRKEIQGTLVGWGKMLMKDAEQYKNRFYQSYLVLNFARMLHDLHEGSIGSKIAGAAWAKINLDPKWIPLIDFCWEERKDTAISVKQPANPKVFKQSLRFVQYVVEQGIKYKIPATRPSQSRYNWSSTNDILKRT